MNMTRCLLAGVASGIAVFAAQAEAPDFIAGAIKNVGGGYFDTGYKAKITDYPKTATLTASITTTDDTATGGNAAYFGYFRDNNLDRLFFRQSGNSAQAWFDTTSATFGQVDAGTAATMTADYQALKLTFNSVEKDWTVAPTVDGRYSLHIFGYNRVGTNMDNTKFKFHSLAIAECASAEAAATTAHEYLPCYLRGRPALYDRTTGSIIYGSDDNFVLYDYDIAIAAGQSLQVTTLCATPDTLTLNAGAEYVFDGEIALTPSAVATLPGSGQVKVSLSQTCGKGVYTLIENLPADFSTDSFAVGSLPFGVTGTLVKDGTTLKMQLTASGTDYPEVMADSIQNDGVGYLDCGYKFKVSAYPKTARIELDFYTTDMAKGTSPGPTVSGGSRSLWGYQYGDDKLFFRYNGDTRQIWSPAGAVEVKESTSGGDMSFVADYLSSTVTWGSLSGTFTPAVRDSAYSYLLFVRGRDGSYTEPSVYQLKAYRIYETDDGTSTTLAYDYRPARVDDEVGLYDVVTGDFKTPTGATSDFTLTNEKYRLSVNGELAYVAGELSIDSIYANTAAWELVNDATEAVIVSGTGATAAFTMPAAAATLKWKFNLPLTDGETKSISGVEPFVAMSVTGAVTLNFDLMARLQLADGLTLGDDAAVTVNYSRIHGPGVYTLIVNAGAATDLTKFTYVADLPTGLTGTLAMSGSDVVLRVSGTITSEADLPEKLLSYVRNDGVGYIDLGYAYHVSTYPHTARLELDYTTTNHAGYKVSGMGDVRTLFGYQNKAKLIVRYSNQNGQIWSPAGGSDIYKISATGYQVVVDYLTSTVNWDGTEKSISTPDADEWCTYTIFARNMGNSVVDKALFDLRAFRIYEQNSEGAAATKKYDYRPCMIGGRLALYETVAKTYKYLDEGIYDGHFTAGEAYYPEDIYGTSSVTQEFASAWSVSPRTVQVRQSDLDHRFTFIADGELVLKEAAPTIVIQRYAVDGTLLGTEELGAQAAGTHVAIKLNGAYKAVVKNRYVPMFIIFK